MTWLLSSAVGVGLLTLLSLLVLVLVAVTVCLLLVATVALQLLLERNGVDARRAAGTAWNRLRGPARSPDTRDTRGPAAARPASGRPSGPSSRPPDRPPVKRPVDPASTSPAERMRNDVVRPGSGGADSPGPAPATEATKDDARSTATAAPVEPVDVAAAAAPEESEPGTAAPQIGAPAASQDGADAASDGLADAPADDSPTAVLPVSRTAASQEKRPAARRPSAATSRRTATERRTSPTKATPSIAPGPPEDESSADADAGTPQGTDRDTAMNRLFAPLLESDSTEPLPAPPRARPARRTPKPAAGGQDAQESGAVE